MLSDKINVKPFNSLSAKTADDKFYICKFSKNISSKLYQIGNSKTRGQIV